MRWLVAGGSGMLGTDLVAALTAAGHPVTAAGRSDLDVTSLPSARDAVRSAAGQGGVVVNCAAWTAVDAAEEHEDAAFAVNATGAQNLALACADAGAALVQVSTDYVFSGAASAPYPVDAPLAPRSAYGRTKAAGEWAVRATLAQHWVVRTAWLYGAAGPSFVRTMTGLEKTRDTVDVVTDQRGQPTWTRDLAERIVAMVGGGVPYGTYHATNAGQTSWHGFAASLFTLLGADPGRVRPTTSAAFPRPAPRPAYSVLDDSGWTAVGLPPMRAWPEALAEAVDQGI